MEIVKLPEEFLDEMIFLPIQEEIEKVIIVSNEGVLNYEEAGFKIMELVRDYLKEHI